MRPVDLRPPGVEVSEVGLALVRGKKFYDKGQDPAARDAQRALGGADAGPSQYPT